MVKKPLLVVMAAGMGSRYGGLKQLDPVGSNGQALMDYSLYDAHRAGFDEAVFIISPKMAEDGFERDIRRRVGNALEIRCAVQRLDDLPAGFAVPEGRVKPWGTAHAVRSCREMVDAPFAAVNADDYYGPGGMKEIFDFLSHAQSGEYCMVGYELLNTLSENGSVARGVCEVDETHRLLSVTERTHIISTCDGALFTEDGAHYERLPDDTLVSLNLWGFTPDIFPAMEDGFIRFLREAAPKNPLKAEYYLPTVVAESLAAGRATAQVLPCRERWFGVTHRQDKPAVVEAIRQKTAEGVYPDRLW